MKPRYFPKKSRKKFPSKVFFLAIPIFILPLAAFAFYKNNPLEVAHIECESDQKEFCEAAINYFKQNKSVKDLEGNLRSTFPQIDTVDVKEQFFRKAVVRISERKLLAELVSPKGVFLVDSKAVPYRALEATSSATHIITTDPVEIILGVKLLSPSLQDAVAALKASFDKDVFVSLVEDKYDYLSIRLKEEKVVWLPLSSSFRQFENYDQVFAALKNILERASVEKRDFKKIDMRYNKITIE